MEFFSLLIKYPAVFLVLGVLLRLLQVKYQIKYFYLINLLVSAVLTVLFISVEFAGSSGAYIYIPFYAGMSILGSLITQLAITLRKSSFKK